MKTPLNKYRVVFENELAAIVYAKNNNSAFRKAKKAIIKRVDYDQTLVDEMSSYGFQNARVIIL